MMEEIPFRKGPILSCAEVRELDRRAIEIFRIPGAILMENAGRSLTEAFCRYVDSSSDAFSLAKRLAEKDDTVHDDHREEQPIENNEGSIARRGFTEKKESVHDDHREEQPIENNEGSIARRGFTERILILAGRGNNGGDGFVMARRLHFLGFHVKVVAVGKSGDWRDEAEMNRAAVESLADDRLRFAYFDAESDNKRDSVAVSSIDSSDDSAVSSAEMNPFVGIETFATLKKSLADADWVIDALLGTGAKGTPRPPINRIIKEINAAGKPVMAVDIPSGLDGDSGTAAGEAIRARLTVTLAAMKQGLLLDAAAPYVGKLALGDIGVSAEKLLNAGGCHRGFAFRR